MAGHGPAAQQPAIDEFFERFTAEWIRGNPNLAIATRYFSGPEQDVLERQLTPLTPEWQRERVRLAERGLTEALGDRFSMKSFHNVVLDVGTVPLQILVSEADAYIRSTAAVEGLMPTEAAAFMYLALGVEEIRD